MSQAEAAENLTGKLLVASETMGDPRFQETVIYMVEHDDGGAMGLVVNRPLGRLPLADLMRKLDLPPGEAEGEIAVYTGGPVEPERAFVLHSDEVVMAGSQRIADGIAITAEPEMLRRIGRDEGPRRSLLAFGYAGWAPGQLEWELTRDAWFVIPAEEGLVFADHPEASWAEARARRGIEL